MMKPSKHILSAVPVLLGFAIVWLTPEPACAGAIQGVICDVVGIVTGDIGRPVATAAILVIALMALFGRVGWGPVMITVTGIAIIFSASNVVAALGMGGGCAGGGGGGGAFQTVLCGAIGLLTGTTSQVLAIGGILTVAVASVMGRVSWGQAGLIAAGIAGLFAAPDIAAFIAGTGGDFCARDPAAGGVFAQFYCRAVSMLSNDAARALALAGVAILAVTALLGRVAWNMAALTAVGIVSLFSAPDLVTYITGEGAACPGAAATTFFGDTLCRAVSLLTNDAARALAVLAVAVLGITAMLGRIAWGTAALTAVSIGALFSAPIIATLITGEAINCPVGGAGIFSDALCRAVRLLTDDSARALATLSVIGVATASMFGRASWHLTIIVGVGISGLFAAPMIVYFIETGIWSFTPPPDYCPVP